MSEHRKFSFKNIKFQLISNDLGVDLGTANVLVYVDKRGIQVREPSVVAMDKNTGHVLEVGAAARNMLGRTPGNLVSMKPLKGGVICDHEMTVRLLQAVFRRATQSGLFTPKPRLVVSVPSGITEVEERTVINAAIEAGARRVYLIEEPLAAALGAGLDISGPSGHMVVDIGAGTTDVAILSMNGVAVSGSSKVAGDTFDDLIVRYLRREHSLNIGQTTAEDIKMQIGTVVRPAKDTYMEVSGYDISTGKPRTHTVSSSEIYRVLQRPARQVADLILTVLEETTPELVGDVFKNGITLTGGMAQLTGMAQLVTEVTGIECVVADDPASCVALGCGKSLAWINHMQEGPVNLARRRLMNKQF